MDGDHDEEDLVIEQNEEDFEVDDGLGTTFRRPTEPLLLVLGEKDRSTTLSLEKKKKELLNIKAKLDIAIG